jgi:hypothetical protein
MMRNVAPAQHKSMQNWRLDSRDPVFSSAVAIDEFVVLTIWVPYLVSGTGQGPSGHNTPTTSDASIDLA